MRAFDLVFDSQRVFRCLLQATANPGKLFALPPTGTGEMEAIARTLLDHEVSFCVVGDGARETEERLSLATGGRVAPPEEAAFAFVSGTGGMAARLGRGTLEKPELGATAVYAVGSLSEGDLSLRLSGPGVPGKRVLEVGGLDREEAEAIRESRSSYPLGVDVYLVDGAGRVVGLPRSTRVEVV